MIKLFSTFNLVIPITLAMIITKVEPKAEQPETLEQAVELCISMLVEFDTTEAEIANLVIKSLQKRNKKLMTTSNKKTIAFKVA